RYEDLLKRKDTIVAAIQEQGKLTPELERRIRNTWDATVLEDLYLPYKRKRKTRASVARERGLEPLAKTLLAQQIRGEVEREAAQYVNAEVPTPADALQGARDIIAEILNEDEATRNCVRRHFRRSALITSKVARGKQEEAAKYQDYFNFSEPLKKCPSHRLLAMRRGEDEGLLRVMIAPEDELVLPDLERMHLNGYGPATEQVRLAIHDAYQRLLAPSIETEFRNSSKEQADKEAIEVFTTNLRQLLLAPPLGQRATLGIDPGFRTGCKVACLDASGYLLHHTTIYPHPPQKQEAEARAVLKDLVERYGIEAIAVGNGTAGRETLALCRSVDYGRKVDVFSVNEAGASIYSASEAAREEFPTLDLTVRGAVSIGRRLMDPLAELVKIDPKSIGVGQYQHDVNQVQLKASLDRTVESCVNSVGINVNTASKHLLTYVSGLGPVLAQNIVDYRTEDGPFRSRATLKKVKRLGEKAFEQSAGFLRIRDGKHPLDNTAVHPERYALVEQMAADLGVKISDLIERADLRKSIRLENYVNAEVGLPTLKDILQELAKPGLDPRGEAQPFDFGNVQTIEDLREGMVLPGIVTNVTNFGCFVDIGIKENGLVHISQLAHRFVKNPADVVSLNQRVQVRVMQVDLARKRVQLSMKAVD
ncbi:MAG: RNA-binding transcriptional accessory protein, partial [Bacteroidetes bacterium]